MGLTPHHIKTFKRLCQCRDKQRKEKILKEGGPPLQHAIREVSHNILKGNVPLTAKQKTKLKKHAKEVRELAKKKTSLKKRLSIEQKGGFLSPLLLPVLGAVASGVIGGFFDRRR